MSLLGCSWTYSCVKEHQFILNYDQCLAFILCLRMLRYHRDLKATAPYGSRRAFISFSPFLSHIPHMGHFSNSE